MTDTFNISKLKKTLAKFSKLREWEKFNSPKNLSIAIAAESGELLRIFQWLTEEESINISKGPVIKEKISHELADVILYIIRMADQLNINLNDAVQQKITINNTKYP